MEEHEHQCLDLLESLILDWSEKKQRKAQLLQALISLRKNNDGDTDEGFSTDTLASEFENVIGKSLPASKSTSSTISGHWNDLLNLWNSKIEGIKQHCLAEKLPIYPIIDKNDSTGGGGLYSWYFLRFKDFPEFELDNEQTASLQNENEIRYFFDDNDQPQRIAKFLSTGFTLDGWRKYFFISTIAVILSGLWLMFVIALFSLKISETAGTSLAIVISSALIFWLIWKATYPFYEIFDFKVSIAPGWLQKLGNQEDRLLLFRQNKPSAPNEILLVTYTATCPTCKGKVHIKNGGKSYPNKLIGRCENSPREHIFSFDHHLRIGQKL